jgi:hypothetical protein
MDVGRGLLIKVWESPRRRPRVMPLTVEQVAALANAMPARYRSMVITQAGLGLRIGELLGLRVGDVDFLRRTVRVEWQFTSGSKVRSEPKTPWSRRTIPAPQVVLDAVAGHLATYPADEDGAVHHDSRNAARPRLLRAQPLPKGGDENRAAGGDDQPRPTAPLRVTAAGRRRIGDRGRRAARPRRRLTRAVHLRPSHAGQRGPHAPGDRCRVGRSGSRVCPHVPQGVRSVR